MRIAYLSTDEVNRDLAALAAWDCGGSLEEASEGPVFEGRFDVLLLDLDHLPPDAGASALECLLSGELTLPVGVHGYAIGDALTSMLRARGVVLAGRLEAGLIRCLCRAARRVAREASQEAAQT